MPETASPTDAARRVSFDDEPLIVVNEKDEVVEHLPKARCHEGEGILHRAFSVFVFDRQGRVLLQVRSDEKPLWPGYWSNSCCSHPRRGETMEEAVSRRLPEELGIEAEPVFLFKFQYHAPFGAVGSEREMCSVYAAPLTGEPVINPTEVSEWSFVEPRTLDAFMSAEPERYTPWFKMEWPRIRRDHWDAVEALLPQACSV